MSPGLQFPLTADSCSPDQMTALHTACVMRRMQPIARQAFNQTFHHLPATQGVNGCRWIEQSISEPHQSSLLERLGCNPQS